ncbi:MAG: hypothetical protein Q8Q26_11735 [Pseudorhodobacter sp.]|nr:hypothetical protein [Pseudorhodobacter sp.]
MKRLQTLLRSYKSDQAGTVIIEAVLMLPLMIWVGLGMYAYWDGYQTTNTSQKGAYVIADLVSRQNEPMSRSDLEGLNQVMNFMLSAGETAKLRVTSIGRNVSRDEGDHEGENDDEHDHEHDHEDSPAPAPVADDAEFEVLWSKSPYSAMPALTTADLQAYTNRIPMMAEGDTVIMVETEVGFIPVFDVGLDPLTIKDLIVTRPRFLPQLCYHDCDEHNDKSHDDD